MKKILGCLAVLGLVLGARAEAADLYVPGSYTTIQAAVNAANKGDTITVSAWTYTEIVTINKGIFLVGAGSRSTIIKRGEMKRKELIKYLEENGAFMLREGRRHTIYQKDRYRTQIPRHNEIVDELAMKICKDLDILFRR